MSVLGRGGVPRTGVAAVVLNVTATEATAVSYVTAFPGGQPRPGTSNLNLLPGATVANSVIVGVGDGTVQLFQHTGSAHLLVDVLGWFPVGSEFSAVAPQRLLDTRLGTATTDDLARAGAGVRGPATVDVAVLGNGGVPAAHVAAVAVNITAVDPTAESYVSVYPSGGPRPLASTLNCLLYTSPSPRDRTRSRMPSSA